MTAEELFTNEEILEIMQAVKDAENRTSGEIKVHIENSSEGKDIMDRAADVFAMLELHKTKLRNGVLFYLAINDKKFAILGDVGVHNAVGDSFWDSIKNQMQTYFRKGNFTLGMIEGIRLAGEKLREKVPHADDDINELSDDISFG